MALSAAKNENEEREGRERRGINGKLRLGGITYIPVPRDVNDRV